MYPLTLALALFLNPTPNRKGSLLYRRNMIHIAEISLYHYSYNPTPSSIPKPYH